MTAYRNQRVLVIGGLGFIGYALVKRLVADGALVRVVTPSRARHAATATEAEALGVEVMEGDLRDGAAMAQATFGQQVVFNLAGQSGAVRSMESPASDLEVNCGGSLVLLEALRAGNREAKVVFVGSRLEYGEARSAVVGEDHPTEPLCLYGVHKLMVEQYLRLYHRLFGIRFVVARVTNPYGPGQPSQRTAYGIVNRLIHLALADAALTIYGDGAQRRDYIYIDDTVEALMRLGTDPNADARIFNVGTGVGTRMVDMAQAIIGLAGRGRIESVAWPELAGQIETGDFVADVSRMRHEFGWAPRISLDEGLRRTIAHYQGQPRA